MIFDPLYSTISSQFSNKYNQTVFYLYQLSQPQAILCCQIPSVATKGEQTILNEVLSIVVLCCMWNSFPSEAKNASSLYQCKCSMPTIPEIKM